MKCITEEARGILSVELSVLYRRAHAWYYGSGILPKSDRNYEKYLETKVHPTFVLAYSQSVVRTHHYNRSLRHAA